MSIIACSSVQLHAHKSYHMYNELTGVQGLGSVASFQEHWTGSGTFSDS